ncbi:MAG: chorismate synthase [Clostridia bacterium]|nr:chorismate synthase [Clostridia bacterium]
MSSMWGERLRLSIFGESHGAGIGVVLDGLPAGEPIDYDEILPQMARRASSGGKISTPRHEADMPEVLSGIFNGRTDGSPLCAIMRNTDVRSKDYDRIRLVPRPGHADYTAYMRTGGFNDYRGGGHFSGRLTAPMVFAGSVCRQILSRRGVEIGAHLLSVAGVSDASFDAAHIPPTLLLRLSSEAFPLLEPGAQAAMRQAVEKAANEEDSVGGIVECAAVGLSAGLGSPIFGGVENRLASILFGIPAVKGIEFGAGFAAAGLRGSENNDAFIYESGEVKTAANHHGGLLGGITSSMPVVFRVAFKPTPSIRQKQQSVDLEKKSQVELEVTGRHDPCVAIRALPVVEALTAVCLLDLVMEG